MNSSVFSPVQRSHALGLLAGLLLASACAPRAVVREVVHADTGVDEPPDTAVVPDAPPPSLDTRPAFDTPPPRDLAPARDMSVLQDRPPITDLPPAPPDAGMEAPPPVMKTALLVVGSTNLSAADAKIRDELVARKLTPRIVNDQANANMSAGTDLIVISASCMAGNVSNAYATAAIPALILEPAVFDNMKMTMGGDGIGADENTGTQIVIALAHPIVNPLPVGMTTVAPANTNLAWGIPGAAAIKIANQVGSTTKFTIFAYEKATLMVGGMMAPARRVGLFVGTDTADKLNATGLQILEQAIDWAVGN